jgi:hypothetical protein
MNENAYVKQQHSSDLPLGFGVFFGKKLDGNMD